MQDTPKPKGLAQLIDDAARERRYMLKYEGDDRAYWEREWFAACDRLREHCHSLFQYEMARDKAIRDSEMPTMEYIHMKATKEEEGR